MDADGLLRFCRRWNDNVPINDILREFACSFGRLKRLVRLLGLPPERDHFAWAPTPEQIAEAAAAIRESWTEEERLLRARRIMDPLPATFYESGLLDAEPEE